jgi:hypothetical protein
LEDKPRSGRPRKNDSTFRRQLGQIKSRHPFESSPWYTVRINLKRRDTVNARTVQRALHELGYGFKIPLRKKLTSAQKLQRCEFARAHLVDTWDNVWAGDESTFNLYREGRRCWVRVSRGSGDIEPAKPKLSRKVEKVSVSIVAAISNGKKSDLAFLPKNWRASELVKSFDADVRPSLRWVYRGRRKNRLIWDNDGRHHTLIWDNYMAENHLRAIRPWPSISPDLNPIENVWAWMKDYVEHVQPDSEHKLREAIRAAWRDFPIEHTKALMESMPARLQRCLELGGGRTNY